MFDFKGKLLRHETSIGIWGSGYIGITSAINFAINGVKVLCYDVNSKAVHSINKGRINMPNLEYWLGFSMGNLINVGLIRAVSDYKKLIDGGVNVHFIAVPTEKEGKPWNEPLEETIVKICKTKTAKNKPLLVIIESTLTPNEIDEVVIKTIKKEGKKAGEEILIGVAPRRDWFHSPEKNLRNLPRIFAGTNSKTTHLMKEVLSIVCEHLIPASNHKIAELVKSVENSFLHIPSVFAMQLSKAYPNVDINEVLRLVSTHWRIPYYYPSMGTGGYCIPVSSKYVIKGAQNPEELTIAHETIKYDESQPEFISILLSRRIKNKVGILGIAYKGDLKVHVLSPAITIANHLKTLKVKVAASDPYYTNSELKKIAGLASFKYPEDLGEFGAIIIVPNHRIYMQTPKKILFKYLKRGQLILDNVGTWEKWRDDFKENGIIYHRIGDKGWCVW